MNQATAPVVDVRTIPHRDRHALIFDTFQALAAGAHLELVNDHDPRPLYFHFQQMFGSRFNWSYVESGPEVWRVQIGKAAHEKGGDSCCGSCG